MDEHLQAVDGGAALRLSFPEQPGLQGLVDDVHDHLEAAQQVRVYGNAVHVRGHAHGGGVHQDGGGAASRASGGMASAPRSRARAAARVGVDIRQGDPAPGLDNPVGDGPGGAPGPQDEDVPALEADFGRQRGHRPQPVGVVADKAPVPVDHGVHRADLGGPGVQFIDQRDDFLFKGDGDAHPADPQTP